MKGRRHRGSSISITHQQSSTNLMGQNSFQKKDQSIKEYQSSAKYLAGVVGMFCFCQLFRVVIIFYDVYAIEMRIKCTEQKLEPNYPYWLWIVSSLNNLMNTINSSGNFIIYAAVGSNSKFRKVFKSIFGCCCQENNSSPIVTIGMVDVV